MESEEIKGLLHRFASAVAIANGHPDPDGWAHLVVAADPEFSPKVAEVTEEARAAE